VLLSIDSAVTPSAVCTVDSREYETVLLGYADQRRVDRSITCVPATASPAIAAIVEEESLGAMFIIVTLTEVVALKLGMPLSTALTVNV